jgi:AcrR family transcriptional regulator
MMFEVENRTQIKRQPRQERSHARFESVLETALRLFAARGYESVSMREIAREAKMPIASVYQYFPMKLAIVREMWTRYTSTISGTLEAGILRSIKEGRNEANHLVGIIIDRMSELQTSNPAFIEIWSCVAASMELRALNVQDTLQNARVIADALQKLHPDCDPSALYDRSLIAIEMASATTRFALALPEPHRARVLLSLKTAISLLIDPVMLDAQASLQPAGQNIRRAGAVGKTKRSGKTSTAKRGRGTVKL